MSYQVLRVDSSLRRVGSFSRKLTDVVIEQIQKQTPTEVKTRDLALGVSPIDDKWVEANMTEFTSRNTEQRAVLSYSDGLISELKNANTLLIGLPIYNFGIPSNLKAWIDQIVRANVTFEYQQQQPVGLLNDTNAVVVVTSGGTELNSAVDYGSNYLKHILGFIGIKDVTFIDGTNLGHNEEQVMDRAHLQIKNVNLQPEYVA